MFLQSFLTIFFLQSFLSFSIFLKKQKKLNLFFKKSIRYISNYKQQINLKMTTNNRRATAADFMLAELDDEKNRVRRLHIERARLFLAGRYELEEGEILIGLEYDETYDN